MGASEEAVLILNEKKPHKHLIFFFSKLAWLPKELFITTRAKATQDINPEKLKGHVALLSVHPGFQDLNFLKRSSFIVKSFSQSSYSRTCCLVNGPTDMLLVGTFFSFVFCGSALASVTSTPLITPSLSFPWIPSGHLNVNVPRHLLLAFTCAHSM